jgi:hypothetical protein
MAEPKQIGIKVPEIERCGPSIVMWLDGTSGDQELEKVFCKAIRSVYEDWQKKHKAGTVAPGPKIVSAQHRAEVFALIQRGILSLVEMDKITKKE